MSDFEDETTETKNLPAIVTRVGGALEAVMNELDAYVDERFPLDRGGQIALGRIIESRPQLNTEDHIAFFVDAFTYHGISKGQRNAFMEMIDEFGSEDVATALEYLYEIGMRDRGDASAARDPKNSMRMVRGVLVRMQELRDSGRNTITFETLNSGDWELRDYVEFGEDEVF